MHAATNVFDSFCSESCELDECWSGKLISTGNVLLLNPACGQEGRPETKLLFVTSLCSLVLSLLLSLCVSKKSLAHLTVFNYNV